MQSDTNTMNIKINSPIITLEKINGRGVNNQSLSIKEKAAESNLKTQFNLLKKMKKELDFINRKPSEIEENKPIEEGNNDVNENIHLNEDNIIKINDKKDKISLQKDEDTTGQTPEKIKERIESEEYSSKVATPMIFDLNLQTKESKEDNSFKKSSNNSEFKSKEEESDKKERLKQKLLRLTLERKDIKEKMEKVKFGALNKEDIKEDEKGPQNGKEPIDEKGIINDNSSNDKKEEIKKEKFVHKEEVIEEKSVLNEKKNDKSESEDIDIDKDKDKEKHKEKKKEKEKEKMIDTEKEKENGIEKEEGNNNNNNNHGVKKYKDFSEIGNIFEILKEKKKEKQKNSLNERKTLKTTSNGSNSKKEKESKSATISHDNLIIPQETFTTQFYLSKNEKEKETPIKENIKKDHEINSIFRRNINIEEMSFRDKVNRLKQIQKMEEDLKTHLAVPHKETQEKKNEDLKPRKETVKTKKEEKVTLFLSPNTSINKNNDDKQLISEKESQIEKKEEPQLKPPSSLENLIKKAYEKKINRKNQFSKDVAKQNNQNEDNKRKSFNHNRNFSQNNNIYKRVTNPGVQISNYNIKEIYQKPFIDKAYIKPINWLYNNPIKHSSSDKLSKTMSTYDMKNSNLNVLGSDNDRHSSRVSNSKRDLILQKNLFKNHSPGKFTKINIQKAIEQYQINIEDLLILEEKISDIILSLNLSRSVKNECFEWWNYIFHSPIYSKIEELFFKENNVPKILKFELLSILICYDMSLYSNNYKDYGKMFKILKEIINLNHNNLIIICDYIISKLTKENMNNTWVFKLKSMVTSSKSANISLIDENMSPLEKIAINSNQISRYINILLKTYPSNTRAQKISTLYKSMDQTSYDEINSFFLKEILCVDNPDGSVPATIVLKDGTFKSETQPYLKVKNIKPYTLILSLDETIVHFKVNPNNKQIGVLRERPGLADFLESLERYYELIIFTVAIEDYADILIDGIEESKIYFDYRLYRQHTIIIDNDFVKDLSRVGRPLDRTVIVDNMPQNFRLQKENGIAIKAFWGEDSEDRALFDLKDILISLAKEGGDIRKSITKYKDEIVLKVTSNISKQQF